MQGGKAGPDPHIMQCDDYNKKIDDPVNWSFDYVYIGKVEIDAKAEEHFRDTSKHFATPLLCTRTATQTFNCVYDTKD